MKKINTWCPLFPGFYGTIYEADEANEIEYINDEREHNNLLPLEFDEFEFDYDDYKQRVVEQFVQQVEEYLSDFDVRLFDHELTSPKFYNFSNDSINVDIRFNEHKVLQYIEDNQEEFEAHIRESYTSCSGFISRHSNSASDWLDSTHEEYWLADTSDHKVGSVLQFILLNEGIDYTIDFEVNEDLHVDDYRHHVTKPCEAEEEEANEIVQEVIDYVEANGGRVWINDKGSSDFMGELKIEIPKDVFYHGYISRKGIAWSNRYGVPEFVEQLN